MEEKIHYICLGDCGGVSENSGVCQAVDCENFNQELVECSCTDGEHNALGTSEDDVTEDE